MRAAADGRSKDCVETAQRQPCDRFSTCVGVIDMRCVNASCLCDALRFVGVARRW